MPVRLVRLLTEQTKSGTFVYVTTTTPHTDNDIVADGNGRASAGRPVIGLYPQFSRTKIAEETGAHLSVIVAILRGRRRPYLDLALRMSAAMDIPIERLEKDLKRARAAYKKQARASA